MAKTEMQNERGPSIESPEVSPQTSSETGSPSLQENSLAWRDEVSARLNRYNSRRKPKPPRYPSLRLSLEKHPAAKSAAECSIFAQRSHDSLAFDSSFETSPRVELAQTVQQPSLDESRSMPGESFPESAPFNSVVFPTAKIIEFPRPWTPPAPPLDQLAEPVIASPRILEAPDLVPPPPALGGIMIETAQQLEAERRPGIDFPLQCASFGRRVFAAAVDHLIVGASCLVSGLVFWKMTALRPPQRQLLEMVAGALVLFWAAYHYLLIVYSGATPGLRLARLHLCRFDGTPVHRRLRRWRVLASFLSALSVGMGYGWVFLDEDSLCWHDRITRTYFAPRR